MSFKKHHPKFRRERETIRRKPCEFCDGHERVASLIPEFGAYIEDHSLPFRTDVDVSGILGYMAVTFTWPYDDQVVLTFRGENLRRPITGIESRILARELIHPRRQRFFIPISHCPKCGREFKNSRQKLWR